MVTSLYTALLAFLCIILSVNVIKARRRYKIALGDNGHYKLRQRLRAHANFTEYTPLFLILLGTAEYQGCSIYGLHALGMLFLSGRIIHAYGVGTAERYENGKLLNIIYRVQGMGCTLTAIGITASIVFILTCVQMLK